ncbi:SGNH_hydro domain-containing protein [Durusdinium trenchii]|uniref:SGNH_hydro domain-containing protein n=1 Tax=Durusdinium trenchii TaxID=1381693 RepID=A0ABP0MIS3_9DINO
MRHRMATSLLYGAAVYHALGEEALAIVWGMIEICVVGSSGTWTILAVGDSLTAGGFGSVPYGAFLSEILGVKVEITGIWGEQTRSMLQRLQSGHPAWFPDPPRVVLVLGGTNDLRSVPLEVTVANLKAMHELAAQTSLVGVLALPKFLNPQVGSHQKRESLNLRLAELVESYSFPSFFVNLSAVPSSYLYDGLHFTSEGYLEFARLVATELTRLLPWPPARVDG